MSAAAPHVIYWCVWTAGRKDQLKDATVILLFSDLETPRKKVFFKECCIIENRPFISPLK